MKRIKITPTEEQLLPIEQYGEYRGQYAVTIFWNQKYHFRSKRKALRFVAITNQFYTRCMYSARLIYADVLNKYVMDWGYFEHDKSTMGFDFHSMKRRCKAALDSIDKSFDLMVERSGYANGTFIVANMMRNVIASLEEAIKVLRLMNEKRNTTMDFYLFDKFIEDVEVLEHSLKSYGDYEAKYLTKRPIHKSGLPESHITSKAKTNAA